MTIESQSQILKAKDRLALRLESEFKTRNQQQYPDPFNAYVFIDHITEEVVRNARANAAPSTTTTATTTILKCRVFDQNFYHAGQNNPLDAKSKAEYQSSINQCQEGFVRIDHADIQNLTNGSIWACTMKNQTVQLLSLVQASAFSFNADAGRVIGGPAAAFRRGGKGLLSKNPRMPGANVSVIYKNNSSNLRAQSKKAPYKDFLPLLASELTNSSFSQVSVQVNSMFRGPKAQVSAMMGTRIFQGNSASYHSFVAWLNSNYTGELGNEVRAIVAEQDWSNDVAGLKSRLETAITAQYNRGRYISTHMESGALDLKTNNLEWFDVQSMLSTLEKLKNAGHIKMYQIENKRPNVNSKPSGSEHIHITLTSKGRSE